VQYADWKHDRASHKETPKALRETREDVSQPSGYTQKPNDLRHY
jgi:hypothetical protein